MINNLNDGDIVEIQDFDRDDLYYIRCTSGEVTCDVDFIMRISNVPVVLPKEVEAILSKYKAYGEGTLDGSFFYGDDYLYALQTQNKGACRHRRIACFDELKKMNPELHVRMTRNVSHAEIEIKHEGVCVKRDLGGYSSSITIHEPHKPPSMVSQAFSRAQQFFSAQPEVVPPKPLERKKTPMQFDAVFKKVSEQARDVDTYMTRLVRGGSERHHGQLVNVLGPAMLQGFILRAYKQARTENIPIFYIHAPHDFVCSASYIQETTVNTGMLKKGPGGRLHDFLVAMQTHDGPSVLLVNYATFKADDRVRLNALLNKNKRVADKTKLGLRTRVIGVMNTRDPNAYQGNDFISRFRGHVSTCPFDAAVLNQELPALPEIFAADDEHVPEAHVLPLFNTPDWRARLSGRWGLDNKTLLRAPGLLDSVPDNTPVLLDNAPWHDDGFYIFWQMRELDNPSEQPIYQRVGYDWESLCSKVDTPEQDTRAQCFVLNPTRLPFFFQAYTVDTGAHTIAQGKGLLERHQGQAISIYVTRELDKDVWALFLSECQRFDVQVSLFQVARVTLEGGLAACNYPHKLASHDKTHVIRSNDVDFIVDKERQGSPVVIDVSELEGTDLLEKKTAVFEDSDRDDEPGWFIFDERPSYLKQALRDGKHVILKGRFSASLLDALAPFLLERRNSPNAPGYLQCLVESGDTSFYPEVIERLITADEQGGDAPWAELKSRALYSKHHPDADTDDNWAGLKSLPVMQPEVLPEGLNTIEQEAHAFMSQRMAAVEKVISYSKVIFLSGQTGVGKSTFMEKHWKPKGEFFSGMKNFKAWLTSKAAGPKTLFVDEINTLEGDLSLLEDVLLFDGGVFYDGEYHTLTDEHYFVGAGNAFDEGGERMKMPLFEKYGRACLFGPLSCAFVYWHVLYPIFQDSACDTHELYVMMLELYIDIASIPSDKVLMTPRELSSMALFTRSYLEAHPGADVHEVGYYFARKVAASVVPEAHQQAFDAKFKASEFIPEVLPVDASNHVWTKSRTLMREQMDMFLRARDVKRNTTHTNAGLSVCLFEGVSGAGKTDLLDDYLQRIWAFKPPGAGVPHAKTYINMSPTETPENRRMIIRDAYMKGDVLVVDEWNSIDLGEGFLNDLFNQEPEAYGFLIMATQNASSMGGRRDATNPEARRTLKLEIPAYTHDELIEILRVKRPGLSDEIRLGVVEAFERRVEVSKTTHGVNKLTLRELFEAADDVLKADRAIRPLQGMFAAKKLSKEAMPPEASSASYMPSAHCAVGIAAGILVGLAFMGVLSLSLPVIGLLVSLVLVAGYRAVQYSLNTCNINCQ